ncbi:MAG TPA: hypothetical protein VGF73_05420, partial [Chthoniobacterales bacterium]
ERQRLAGRQKVSGVNWRRTLSIGCQIVAAGGRTRRNFRDHPASARPSFAHPNSGRRSEA